MESQTYVLHSTQVITDKGVKAMATAGVLMSTPGGGASAIFGPDGRKLSENAPPTEETILYANLDMDEIIKAKTFADATGHYSRPDLMWLGVDTRDKTPVRHREDKADPNGAKEQFNVETK